MKTDVAMKYFQHVRKIWEERKLRETFEKAFQATKFADAMAKYVVKDPTYPIEQEPEPEINPDASSIRSESTVQTTTSRVPSIRSNITKKIVGDGTKEIRPVEVHYDLIKEMEGQKLYQRNFQDEWNQLALYMQQFQDLI